MLKTLRTLLIAALVAIPSLTAAQSATADAPPPTSPPEDLQCTALYTVKTNKGGSSGSSTARISIKVGDTTIWATGWNSFPEGIKTVSSLTRHSCRLLDDAQTIQVTYNQSWWQNWNPLQIQVDRQIAGNQYYGEIRGWCGYEWFSGGTRELALFSPDYYADYCGYLQQ